VFSITRNVLIAGAVVGVFTAGAAAKKNEDPEKFQFEHVSCNGADNQIRLVVTGVKRSAGLITADLYRNQEDGFLKKRGRITQVKFAAKAPVTSFCIIAPKAGSFAIALYHDENANDGFDKGPLGLPAEPWGISNNPKVRFKPPPVEKALFEVSHTGAEVEIKLK
jgi:uncharacterized protein (DUF2141 family)